MLDVDEATYLDELHKNYLRTITKKDVTAGPES
jgi:hypothetical protein